MSSEEIASTSPGLFRRTIQRHWVGLLAGWIIGTAAVVGLIYSQVQPKYRASSILRADTTKANLYGLKLDDETLLKVESLLITSPNILTAASMNPQVATLKRIQGAQDSVQELKKVIHAAAIPGTRLIEVSMTSPDAAESVVIVNAVVEAYLATNEEGSDGITRKQIKSLEQYLHDLNAQTDELERRWKELVAYGDIDARPEANARQSVTIEQYKKVRNDILEIDLQLAEARAVLATAKSGVGNPPADLKDRVERLIQRRFLADPEVMALAADLAKAQEKVNATLKLAASADDAAVKSAQRSLDAIKEKHNQLWTAKNDAWRKEIDNGGPNALNPEQEVRELTAKVDTLQARKHALQQKAAELKVDNQRAATDQVDIKLLQDQRASIKAMQETVQRRLEQLRYESRGETRVRKLTDAVPSNKPVSDLRPLFMAIVPFAVFFLTFDLFLVFEGARGPRSRLAVEPIVED